jgi:hypothetical protein
MGFLKVWRIHKAHGEPLSQIDKDQDVQHRRTLSRNAELINKKASGHRW